MVKAGFPLGVIVFGVTLLVCSGADTPHLTADSVLGAMVKSSATIKSFSAEQYESSPAATRSTNPASACMYFQTNHPDGRVESRVEVRMTTGTGATNSTITIQNGDGLWLLARGRAIKMEFFGSQLATLNQSMATMPPPDKNGMSATVEQVTFHEIPCYLLTETMDTSLADTTKHFIQNSGLDKVVGGTALDINKLFPVKCRYYVGRNDYFLYSVQKFDKDDAKVSELTYSKVKINPVLPENTFSLPQGTQIIIARSIKEYVDGLAAVYTGNPAYAAAAGKPVAGSTRYLVLIFSVGSALLVLFYLYKDLTAEKIRAD